MVEIGVDAFLRLRPPSGLLVLLDQVGTFHNTNGKGCDRLPEYLEEELGRERAVAIYFEDFDLMDDVGRIVCGIKDAALNADTPMAAILVSSNDPDEIGGRCRDRLNIVEVQFDRYGREELVSILTDRVDLAFKSDSIADGVVERIADRVSELESSCRHGIQPLAAPPAKSPNGTAARWSLSTMWSRRSTPFGAERVPDSFYNGPRPV